MSSKPGRNDPCPCGSGQKYKRCCLPREEAAQAEARKRALDEDLGEDQVFVDVDDSDGDLPDTPPIEPADVRTVRYARGPVQRLDPIDDEDLRVTLWTAPGIPAAILEALQRERVEQLDGEWGDVTAGHPIQVDIVQIETVRELFVIEVFNRGFLLMRADTDEVQRVHRLCVALERADAQARDGAAAPGDSGCQGAAPAEVRTPVPFRVNLDALWKEHRRQPGACLSCGAELTLTEARTHVPSCAPPHDAAEGPAQQLLHLEVTAPGLPAYWMEIEMRADARLNSLDHFLRDIWVECCGHLSAFRAGRVEYVSDVPARTVTAFGVRRTARSMAARLADALEQAKGTLVYEYDFGSTTRLGIEVKGRRTGRIGGAIRLLARNRQPVWPCIRCGEPAMVIDREAAGYPYLCRQHAPADEDAATLPVVNSPRTGVCGYTTAT